MPQRPRGLPKVFILVVVLSAATVFSIVDHVHDQQLSVALLYLSLVSIVAWYDSARSAAVLCVTVAAALLIDAVAFRGADGGRFIHYWNATQIVALCVVASAVVSRLKAALQAERELSWIDETTGLFRRAAFMELLTGEVDRSQRYARPFTLLYADIDRFGAFNRERGRDSGDELLRLVAQTIRASLRSTDAIARFVADDLVILMPETAEASARSVAVRLHQQVAESISRRGWNVTVTLAAVAFIAAPASVEDALEEVERVMLAARSGGPNSVRVTARSVPRETHPPPSPTLRASAMPHPPTGAGL